MPITRNPRSSRGSLHVPLGAESKGLPPSAIFSTTAAATAAITVPPRTPFDALPITSSIAKTTPVIGVLKIAAIPAAM